jgi:hypothetical protein
MADLAAHLDVVPRSVTTMIDALESAGLVARHADPGDRRSVLVTLSEDGRLLLDRLEKARHDSADEVFGGLDAAQRHQLLGLLGVLCERGSCVTCCGPAPSPGHGHRHGHGQRDGHGHGHGAGHGHGGTVDGGDR